MMQSQVIQVNQENTEEIPSEYWMLWDECATAYNKIIPCLRRQGLRGPQINKTVVLLTNLMKKHEDLIKCEIKKRANI